MRRTHCDGHGRHRSQHHPHGAHPWFAGLWHAIGRHRPRGGFGGGPFGGAPFGGGPGGMGGFGNDDALPRGRQFSSDDLQLLLLALLAEQPSSQ